MASPGAGNHDPERLTFSYTVNDDGWVTAQIVEYPAAISQGASREEAQINALEALHDLTHEPTAAERVAFAVQAQLVEPVGELLSGLRGFLRDQLAAAADRSRNPVH